MLFNLANCENLTGIPLHVKLIRQFYEALSSNSTGISISCCAG